jgi:hypothetical protein
VRGRRGPWVPWRRRDTPVIAALDMFVHLRCCVEASLRATSRRRQDRLLEIGATTPIVSELAHGLALRAQGDVRAVGLRCPVSPRLARDYRRDYAPCAAGLVVRGSRMICPGASRFIRTQDDRPHGDVSVGG